MDNKDGGKTKPLPELPDYERRKKELSTNEKIDQAISMAIQEIKVKIANSEEIEEVRDIILDSWDVLSKLVNVRVPSDYNANDIRSAFKEFVLDSQQRGLPVRIVGRAEMPGSIGEKGEENYGQLDTDQNRWVLKFDSETLQKKILNGDRSVADEMSHEFFAWKLFSRAGELPDLQQKVRRNKEIELHSIIPARHPTIFQTHFFDIVFDKLVLVSR
jgi:hypothetical protein